MPVLVPILIEIINSNTRSIIDNIYYFLIPRVKGITMLLQTFLLVNTIGVIFIVKQ